MEIAKITVSGSQIDVTQLQPVTSGMIGAHISMAFDDSWRGMLKTIVWYGSGCRVYDSTASGVIPADVVRAPGSRLMVGLYGVAGGTATPTIWADLGTILAGADPSGEKATDPTLPVWAQIQAVADEAKTAAEAAEGNTRTAAQSAAESAAAAAQAQAVADCMQEKADTGAFNGKDGVSVTHEWNGSVLTVMSASGTSSADLKGEKGDPGEQGIRGPQGLPGTDPKAIAAEVEKQLEPMEERVALSSEGASANYNVTSTGWKRIVISSRSNSGTVNVGLTINNAATGRTFQNITFGYSCAVEHPGAKTGERRASLNSAEPKLWQITNHCFGEDPSQSGLARLFRIDKVRLAYPAAWDELEDANTNNRYSNPINTYLDVHISGELAEGLVLQLMYNVAGKTHNHNTAPVTEETDAPMSEDGYVLGIDDVKCHTKELVLWEEGMMDIPGQSRFDSLSMNRLDALAEKTITVTSGEQIAEDIVDVERLEIEKVWTYVEDEDPDDSVSYHGVAQLSIRAAYKENLLPGCRVNGGQPAAASVGISFERLWNGVFRLTGTSTATLCNWIYEYKEGDCPIKLLKGHTYYAWGQQIRMNSSLEATSGWTDVQAYDKTTWMPKLVSFTPKEDLYLRRTAFYCHKGTTYDGTLIYPQLTEDESLIVGDLNKGGEIYAGYEAWCKEQALLGLEPKTYLHYLRQEILPEKMYSPPSLTVYPKTKMTSFIEGDQARTTEGPGTLWFRSGIYSFYWLFESDYYEEDIQDGDEFITVGRYGSCDGGQMRRSVLQAGVYREMMKHAGYIFCSGGSGVTLTCTVRVPVVENGRLTDTILEELLTQVKSYVDQVVQEKEN